MNKIEQRMNKDNMINKFKIWSIEETNQLLLSVNNKKSYEKIALEHNRTHSSILAKVISFIIYPKYEINPDIQKLSEDYRIKNTLLYLYIKNISDNIYRDWSIEETNQLLLSVNNKKSYEKIALEHNRTHSSILAKVISFIIYPKYEINPDIQKLSEDYRIKNTLVEKYIKKMNILKSDIKIKKKRLFIIMDE
jgi:hemerythrin